MLYPNDSNSFGLYTPEREQGLESRSPDVNINGSNIDEGVKLAMVEPEHPFTNTEKQKIRANMGIADYVEFPGINNNDVSNAPTAGNLNPIAHITFNKPGKYIVGFNFRYRKTSATANSNVYCAVSFGSSIDNSIKSVSDLSSFPLKSIDYITPNSSSFYFNMARCFMVDVTADSLILNLFLGADNVGINISRIGVNSNLYAVEV